MKKIILLIVVVLTAISCKSDAKNKIDTTDPKNVIQVESSKAILIDAEHSKVIWRGFKPGGEHYGLITISEGTISVRGSNLIGGSFKFDMNSITDLDMPIEDEMNAKLVNHLKSSDFFDVEKFPTSAFEITGISDLGGELEISGNLTIKDITKNITIPAAMVTSSGKIILKSDVFTVDRADFNVRYGSKRFFNNLKDKFINDEFELSFELNTIQ